MPTTDTTPHDTASARQPVPPPKVPGEPAPDEDKCNLPDRLADDHGDVTNQPAFDKDQLRRLPAD